MPSRSRVRRRPHLPATTRVLLVAGLATAACGDAAERDGGAAALGEAPAYSARTLDGDSISLADLRGAPVLLNVWATWCAPCRQEIPQLQALHEEHGARGLRVIGVTVDSRSAADDVRAFIDEFGITYDIWWDPDQNAVSAFEAVGVPLTVLIGPGGQLHWRHLGVLRADDASLQAALETVLGA